MLVVIRRQLVQLDQDAPKRARGHLLHLDKEPLPALVTVVLLLYLPQYRSHQQQCQKAPAKRQQDKEPRAQTEIVILQGSVYYDDLR